MNELADNLNTLKSSFHLNSYINVATDGKFEVGFIYIFMYTLDF